MNIIVKKFGFYPMQSVCVRVHAHFVFNFLTRITLHDMTFKKYKRYTIKASLLIYSIAQPPNSPPQSHVHFQFLVYPSMLRE